MLFIGLGIIGFAFMFISDICNRYKRYHIKVLIGLLGIFSIAYSTFQIISIDYVLSVSIWIRIISVLFTVVFSILLVYSIFIEVSITNKDHGLITSGTYALSRHPGVLWLFMVYLFASFVFGNYGLLLAGIVWTLVNILYVYLQEKYIFIYLFENYDGYQDTTPMLLPGKKQIIHLMKKLSGGKNEEFKRNA